ncbi:cache domain-containing protein [Methanobacterium alcaliphilum]|uniref:cache domain-containing protein n=1 Tax=Methanobacterium alcaliphilum TaxID=392018 RepID=UPI00200AD858|nr:cache domain-containing protein [Methanobacterium alcaliphilum]MCK9150823.1 cache domain-containing protein [Methanobacterium alcaliphilum]
MSKTTILLIILMVLVAFVGIFTEQQIETKQKKEVKTLVDDAVQLIEKKGSTAFSELKSDSWVTGDLYVFVWRLDGIRVVYPPDVTGEGKNMTDLVDSNGKAIGKLFIQTAENGEGWVEYYWPKPNQTEPSKKITYIKRAEYQNQTYLVGAGFYV